VMRVTVPPSLITPTLEAGGDEGDGPSQLNHSRPRDWG